MSDIGYLLQRNFHDDAIFDVAEATEMSIATQRRGEAYDIESMV